MTPHEHLAARQALLAKLALRINADVPKEQLKLVAQALSDVELACLHAGCEQLARRERFWPSEVVIREAAAAEGKRRAEAREARRLAASIPDPVSPERLKELLAEMRAAAGRKKMP